MKKLKRKKSFKEMFDNNKMDDLEFFTKSALVERAKEMGLKNFHNLKKAKLIELIKNPPPKIDDLDSFSKPALLKRVKEMGLQGRYGLTKKGLIELIRNPPPPRAKYTGVKKKVTIQPVDTEGELVFPSIYAAAKHFNVNSGKIGNKCFSIKEETKSTIVLDGIKYKLRFESYTLKKCKD